MTVDVDDGQSEDDSDHEVEEVGSHDEDDATNDNSKGDEHSRDPFSLHVSFDVEPHLPELENNITSFQFHNVSMFVEKCWYICVT